MYYKIDVQRIVLKITFLKKIYVMLVFNLALPVKVRTFALLAKIKIWILYFI